MKRSAGFIKQNVAGQSLLIPLGARVKTTNGIITLNESGAYVWDLLAHEHTLEQLTGAVAGRFDVSAEAARADLKLFLDEMTVIGAVIGAIK